ncbi:RNA-directed DNA polymerase, eukaryota, nucleotide-binding alpha-beta plait domain protein [Tanacetum coccineum]|uniref:RNA-directed DNA polymerase, eukaryota, nucleotide-binding alpha-beta plait domain protein n=1 Tax=Tanacetum coccineum TaxID=301880 RepID=A0ABQ5HG81_9ASTR
MAGSYRSNVNNTRRSQNSNEELTQKISHSIFVTNFPDSVNSRDLWRECSVYGTVVDVFIPSKKSKAETWYHSVQKEHTKDSVQDLSSRFVAHERFAHRSIRPPGLIPLAQGDFEIRDT